jgi:hypothetical protein
VVYVAAVELWKLVDRRSSAAEPAVLAAVEA